MCHSKLRMGWYKEERVRKKQAGKKGSVFLMVENFIKSTLSGLSIYHISVCLAYEVDFND